MNITVLAAQPIFDDCGNHLGFAVHPPQPQDSGDHNMTPTYGRNHEYREYWNADTQLVRCERQGRKGEDRSWKTCRNVGKPRTLCRRLRMKPRYH
ncbi:hypothetical protein K2Q16_04585 [Patescibacteria group bacterium]|nr:hypothetical protein [Patescibacteria group bacterium]